MSVVSVNSVEVDVGSEITNELAAARELLRQRAVAIGLLEMATANEVRIDQRSKSCSLARLSRRHRRRRNVGGITRAIRGNSRAEISCTRGTFCSK